MSDTPGMPIVLVEDEAIAELGPIIHTRPAFELRCGLLNLRERIQATGCAATIHGVVRPELSALLDTVGADAAPATGEVVVVDARVDGPVDRLRDVILGLESGDRRTIDGRLVFARVDAGEVDGLGVGRPCDAPEAEGLGRFERPWQLIPRNDRAIVDDVRWLCDRVLPARQIFGVRFEPSSKRLAHLESRRWIASADLARRFPGVTWIQPDDAWIAETARVRPGAVIDAEDGPVVLAPGAVVHPLSVVTGPAYVGPGTVVNPGAKLRGGSSLGAFCKVGGEIEESIVLDLSNKQHDGFLGHALVGSWVNLGADTNGSDLKNNYGPVRVDLGDGPLDTGSSFVGQHLADHVKTGIDTMLTTGGVVGVAGNVFGGGFAPRFVPAFAWGGSEGMVTYRLEDALATARAAMARRDVTWTAAVEALLRHVFDATGDQRTS